MQIYTNTLKYLGTVFYFLDDAGLVCFRLYVFVSASLSVL